MPQDEGLVGAYSSLLTKCPLTFDAPELSPGIFPSCCLATG